MKVVKVFTVDIEIVILVGLDINDIVVNTFFRCCSSYSSYTRYSGYCISQSCYTSYTFYRTIFIFKLYLYFKRYKKALVLYFRCIHPFSFVSYLHIPSSRPSSSTVPSKLEKLFKPSSTLNRFSLLSFLFSQQILKNLNFFINSNSSSNSLCRIHINLFAYVFCLEIKTIELRQGQFSLFKTTILNVDTAILPLILQI